MFILPSDYAFKNLEHCTPYIHTYLGTYNVRVKLGLLKLRTPAQSIHLFLVPNNALVYKLTYSFHCMLLYSLLYCCAIVDDDITESTNRYKFICVYLCMYTSIFNMLVNAYSHTYMYVYPWLPMLAYMHVSCNQTSMHVCLCTHLYIHMNVYVRTYI